jgi:nucleoside-diphosphate-sugar epimerase
VVLGSGGFIGRTLLAALDQAGIPTLGLSRVELDLATDGASERLATMLRTTDAVVLLAALTPNKGRGIPPFLANIRIAANVCTALGAVTPAHVVYFSSDALYPMDIGRITETSCAQPADLYGMMHLTRETMLKASTRTPLAVLRPTLIYGAADPHNSYGPNRFRRMAHHEGKITLFGAGEELRDHLLVDDAVALTRLVLCHRSSGTLNLATGRSIAYSALAKKIAALFDKPIDIVLTPRQNPITYRHFDITALHKAFPTYTFTPLDTGLAKVHRDMLERE